MLSQLIIHKTPYKNYRVRHFLAGGWNGPEHTFVSSRAFTPGNNLVACLCFEQFRCQMKQLSLLAVSALLLQNQDRQKNMT
jgi:hypothetical protein